MGGPRGVPDGSQGRPRGVPGESQGCPRGLKCTKTCLVIENLIVAKESMRTEESKSEISRAIDSMRCS